MSTGNRGNTPRSGGSSNRPRGGRRGATRSKPASSPSTDKAAVTPPAPRLEGPPGVVLERLRDRIHDVVREIDALRQENARLSQQIAALEEEAEGSANPALLRFDEPPEILREKIEGFIQALDTYLEGEEH